DSMPFPESNPLNAGYDKMEEVSLEQLLEGRERPATMSGNVPIPVAVEDVEVLGAEEMVPVEESPLAVALMDEPARPAAPAPPPAPTPASASAASSARVKELEARVRDLEQQLAETVRTLTDLTARLRGKIQ